MKRQESTTITSEIADEAPYLNDLLLLDAYARASQLNRQSVLIHPFEEAVPSRVADLVAATDYALGQPVQLLSFCIRLHRRRDFAFSLRDLEHGEEGFLGDIDLADLAHPLLAGLLLLQQLALARDVPAVALGEHVLAEGRDAL